MQHHTDEHLRRNEEEYVTLRSADLVTQLRATLDQHRRIQERRTNHIRVMHDILEFVGRPK